jgi:hypothetical protein
VGCKNSVIPDYVTAIGDYAFRDCTSLQSITVAANNPIYKSEGNCIIEKATNTLLVGCKNSVIPDYVTAIGDYAFKSYPADKTAKSIVVPESVRTIGIGAFEDCTRLKKLVLPENISKIGEDAFKGIGGYSLFLGENIRISGAKQLFMSQDESWYSKRFDCAPIEMCFDGIIDKDAVAIKYFRSAIAKNKKKIFNQIISQSLTKRLVNFLEISNKISAKELDL